MTLSRSPAHKTIHQRLTEQGAGPRVGLQPDEWKRGGIACLIDATGNADGISAGLRWLEGGPFKERSLRLLVGADKRRISTLRALESAIQNAERAR